MNEIKKTEHASIKDILLVSILKDSQNISSNCDTSIAGMRRLWDDYAHYQSKINEPQVKRGFQKIC